MGRKNIKSHLKAKAYRNVAKANKSRRHRQAVESADETLEAPKKKRRKKGQSESESPKKRRKIGKKKTVKREAGNSKVKPLKICKL